MKHSIHIISRLVLVILGILIFVSIKLPLWRIDLSAPQYPEGLQLLIYPSHLGGDVEIVSGLNHYIGMKALHTEDFYEFKILPKIFLALSILLIFVAISNRKGLLKLVFLIFLLFGIVAMIDFWKWEYNYGHNLNPEAPIIVPGMAYQPPLIGYKQLLNFGAYSIPAIGGWIFAGVGLCLLLMNIAEIYIQKKARKFSGKVPAASIAILMLIFFSSCGDNISPIVIGKDVCSYCKMPVSDIRFGGELVTSKGKVYKFDDAHCLMSFYHSEALKEESKTSVYFVDFSEPHLLVPVSSVMFLQSDLLHSPMNGNMAAFTKSDSLQGAMSKFSGKAMRWDELNKQQ